MASPSIYIGLLISVGLMMAATGNSSPLNYKSIQSKQHEKRNIMRPLISDVNRCIMACGECSDDLDTPDDKVL